MPQAGRAWQAAAGLQRGGAGEAGFQTCRGAASSEQVRTRLQPMLVLLYVLHRPLSCSLCEYRQVAHPQTRRTGVVGQGGACKIVAFDRRSCLLYLDFKHVDIVLLLQSLDGIVALCYAAGGQA